MVGWTDCTGPVDRLRPLTRQDTVTRVFFRWVPRVSTICRGVCLLRSIPRPPTYFYEPLPEFSVEVFTHNPHIGRTDETSVTSGLVRTGHFPLYLVYLISEWGGKVDGDRPLSHPGPGLVRVPTISV